MFLPHVPASLLHAYAAPLLAFVMALGGALLCRSKARRAWLPAVASIACLAGWTALLPLPSVAALALAPHGVADALLLPAVVGLSPSLVRTGRLARALPVLTAMFAGWWLARTGAGRVEFWRVGFAVTVLTFVLWRITKGDPARSCAAAAALWGGAVLLGGGPGAIGAALVGVAALLGTVLAWALPAGAAAGLPSVTLAALIGAVDLAGGRFMRGGVDGADLAALAAVAAPLLQPTLARRIGKQFGAGGPAGAALLAAGMALAAGWVLQRVLRH